MADDFVEKLRSIQFRRGPAAPKVTKHRTDTAWVTETESTDRMDVNVAMDNPVKEP